MLERHVAGQTHKIVINELNSARESKTNNMLRMVDFCLHWCTEDKDKDSFWRGYRKMWLLRRRVVLHEFSASVLYDFLP